jgi:hypothetical protein
MKRKRSKIHSLRIEFSDEPVTSFGGLALPERLAQHLGLWRVLEERLPARRGEFSWLEIIKACVGGLLTGGRGTFAAEELREDAALLWLLGLEEAPEEATVWRCLEGLGQLMASGELGAAQGEWARRILAALSRRELLECEGWLPVFADGSLLEGSGRREGTKHIKDKGRGLMWTTIFVGPLIAAQAIAKPGEGEETLVRRLAPQVVAQTLKPLRLVERALVLADSLNGKGPSLEVYEQQQLKYIVGAGALSQTDQVLKAQPETQWVDLGAQPKRGWIESAVCLAWVQCEDWKEKRLLVGRRVVRQGDMFPIYYGVLTNLTQADLGAENAREFARKVWRLYEAKGRMELRYQDALSDLGLHHPPCQQHVRNAGFYALGTLAHTLGVGVELIGGRRRKDKPEKPAKADALKVPPKIRVKPRRSLMRLWRVSRRLFALPARLCRHARTMTVTLLGASAQTQQLFQHYWTQICRC